MPALFDSGSRPTTRSANAKINSAMYASLTAGSTFVDGTGGALQESGRRGQELPVAASL